MATHNETGLDIIGDLQGRTGADKDIESGLDIIGELQGRFSDPSALKDDRSPATDITGGRGTDQLEVGESTGQAAPPAAAPPDPQAGAEVDVTARPKTVFNPDDLTAQDINDLPDTEEMTDIEVEQELYGYDEDAPQVPVETKEETYEEYIFRLNAENDRDEIVKRRATEASKYVRIERPISDYNRFNGQLKQSVTDPVPEIETDPMSLALEKQRKREDIEGSARNEIGMLTNRSFIRQTEEEIRRKDRGVYTPPERSQTSKMDHMAGLFAEKSAISVAGMIDLFLDFDSWRKGKSKEHEVYIGNGAYITVRGREPDQIANGLKLAMVTAYDILGMEPTLEEYEDALDGVPYLAGMIFGASGVIKKGADGWLFLAKRSVAKTGPLKKWIAGFWAGERKMAVPMIGAGTFTAAAMDTPFDWPEDREKHAAMGSIIPLVPSIAKLTFYGARIIVSGAKARSNARAIEQANESMKKYMAGDIKEIPKTMTDLVGIGNVPYMEKILGAYKIIKKTHPDFNPDITIAVDTADAVHKSKQLGTALYRKYALQHNKNVAILDEVIENAVAPHKYKDTGELIDTTLGLDATQVEMLVATRLREVHNYQAMLANTAAASLKIAQGSANPRLDSDEAAAEVQKGLTLLKKTIKKESDKNYESIDPDDIIRVSGSAIHSLVIKMARRMKDKSHQTASTDEQTIGWLENQFKHHVNTQLGKKPEGEKSNIILPIIIKPFDGSANSLNFEATRNLIKVIGRQANKVRQDRSNYSENHELLSELQVELNNLIDISAKHTDDLGLIERLRYANAFYSKAYANNFKVATNDKHSVATAFTRKVSGSGEYEQTAAGLGKRLWNSADPEDLRRFVKTSETNEEAASLLDALDEYVLSKVDDVLKVADNPYAALVAYRDKYRHSLKLMPSIDNKLNKIAEDVYYNQNASTEALRQITKIDNDSVMKSLHLDGDGVADFLYAATPKQVSEFLDTIAKGTTYKMKGASSSKTIATSSPGSEVALSPSSEIDLIPNLTAVPSSEEVNVTLQALRNIFINKVRMRNLDSSGDRINSDAFHKWITNDQNKRKIDMILGTGAEKNTLTLMDDVISIKLDPIKPMRKEDINAFRNWVKQSGTTIEGQVTKQYAVAQKRISRVFLVMENSVRALLKISDKQYIAHYDVIMKDWVMLERAIKARKLLESAVEARESDELLKQSVDMRTFVEKMKDKVRGKPADVARNLITRYLGRGKMVDSIVSEAWSNETVFTPEEFRFLQDAADLGYKDMQIGDEIEGDEYEDDVLTPTGKKTIEGRPIYKDNKGFNVTERSSTVLIDGKFYNIPTVHEGKELPVHKAKAMVVEAGLKDPITGRQLEGFNTEKEAIEAAKGRSDSIGKELESSSNRKGDEDLIAKSANDLINFKRGQADLREEPPGRRGTLNPDTGKVTWSDENVVASKGNTTNDENVIANSANELSNFKREQAALREQPSGRRGSLNPNTGEVTWLT